MRTLRLLGTTLVVTLALAGIASATALAELGFLPVGATLTAKSGKAKLQVKGGPAIECNSSTATSGAIALLLVNIHVDFKFCKFLGVGNNSTGDPAETILVLLDFHLCYISKSAK